MSEEEYFYSDGFVESDCEEEVPKHKVHFSKQLTLAEPMIRLSPEYRVTFAGDIGKEQLALVSDLKDILGSSTQETFRLLMEFRWAKDDLIDAYLKDGLDVLLVGHGLRPKKLILQDNSCSVCYEDLDMSNSLSNPFCGHAFCLTCWEHYAVVQVCEGRSRLVKCMCEGCACFVAIDILAHALKSNPNELLKFNQAIRNSYVEDNSRIKWCPSVPCCGNVIDTSSSLTQKIDCECVCEEIFCFSCYSQSHSPTPCDWAHSWKKMLENDAPTALFLSQNCKSCPRCRTQVEKAGGCNHVTCKCGAFFCWLCGAETGRNHSINSIAGHTCSKHRQEQNAGNPVSNAKGRLETLVFYAGRYDAHMRSREHESKLLALLGGAGSGSIEDDMEWLATGIKQLMRMRQFLAWTFPLSYNAFYEANGERIKAAESHLKDAGAFYYQTLYEGLQDRLQSSLEDLSALVSLDEKNSATRSEILTLIHSTNIQASNLWKFILEEVFSRGLSNVHEPNPYFPIRRIVTGFGAKLVNEDVPKTSQMQKALQLRLKASGNPKEIIDLVSEDEARKKRRNARRI